MKITFGKNDKDFRNQVLKLFKKHITRTFTAQTADRIAQVVFMEKFNANFHRVFDPHLLVRTERGNDGFGSTGVQVIKKAKKEDEIQFTTSEENLQMVPEKSKKNLQITYEEAVMTVNNEVVVNNY